MFVGAAFGGWESGLELGRHRMRTRAAHSSVYLEETTVKQAIPTGNVRLVRGHSRTFNSKSSPALLKLKVHLTRECK